MQLEELVHAFFIVERGHDREVDGAAEINKIRLSEVLDLELAVSSRDLVLRLLLLLFLFLFLLALFILAEDLGLDLAVTLLVLDKVGVGLEDVEPFLELELVIEADFVGNLVVVFNKVERGNHAGIIAEALLARLREHFDHVLHTHADLSFVEHRAEAVKYTLACFWCLLGEECASLAHERDRELDRVVSGLLEEQHEHLERKQFVCHPLVHKVCHKQERCVAFWLVAAPERAAELRHEAVDEQLTDVWQLGVHDSNHGCEHRREV